MGSTKKLSASIDSELYDTFEDLRKQLGESNRSKAIQEAIKLRIKQWKRQKLEDQCKRAAGEMDSLVEDSYELQGKALRSKFDR